MRRKLVAGNWKMYGDRTRLGELDAIAAAARSCPDVDVLVCPPAPFIERAALAHPGLAIGAQDCHEAPEGPHTGCISAAMLRESGATHVIVGHSERRAAQGETDAIVRAKSKTAIAAGLIAVVCIGETEAEHQAGEAESIVVGQVFGSVTKYAQPETVIVSYEPIWAIGTGRTPSHAEVASMHRIIRDALCRKLGDAIGQGIRILYGGSVQPQNAAALLSIDNVDGVLVGRASLAARDFVPIIQAASAPGLASVAA
jgi:triosephosphate isomerase